MSLGFKRLISKNDVIINVRNLDILTFTITGGIVLNARHKITVTI